MKNGLVKDEDKEIWYLDDEFHREDGPAVKYTNGDKFWFQYGERHRIEGPAVEFANGGKFWYKNDQLHRTDGPAVNYSYGLKEWHIHGEKYTENEFKIKINLIGMAKDLFTL